MPMSEAFKNRLYPILLEIKEHSEIVDVVGLLCESNDKFAIQRELPPIEDNDILIIQDSDANGHAMGFNYNGKLRPKDLLLQPSGWLG